MFDPDDSPDDGELLVRAVLDASKVVDFLDPTSLLIYGDWLEEEGAIRHATLARSLVGAEWWRRRGAVERYRLTNSGVLFAEISWWDRAGRWFWEARGRKGSEWELKLAQRAALSYLLTHKAFACSCKTLRATRRRTP